MSDQHTIEFAISGSVAGKDISATRGVPFSRFAEFNADVQQYVQGGDSKSVLNDVQVQVKDGSYLLRVIVPAGILASLFSDTAKTAQTRSLSDIDRRRAEVVQRWQEKARMEPSLTYVVRSSGGVSAELIINHETSYEKETQAQWVEVERYLIGQITDWGGAQRINVHLRPRNSKTEIIIAASESQIREQRENLVFHKAIIHVRAKQNTKSGELNDYELIELRAYGPRIEDSRLQELFSKGAKAWAKVPNAGVWVEELRGGANA